jgi:Putative prokaryotic signal transducing protein
MKTVYQAGSAFEAHMLVDLLRQDGITGHVRGEFLQGAIGELPAGGLVRIDVDEADHDRARKLIDAWEKAAVPSDAAAAADLSEAPATAPATAAPTASRSGTGRAAAALLGLLVGVGASWAFFRSPMSVDGIDHNRDGVLDERWTYSPSGAPLRTEIDRNLDGRIDAITTYDARGHVDRGETDDDFDGRFETRISYRAGNVESTETDTDGDGHHELRTYYQHGVVETVEYLDKASGRPRRVEHLRLGRVNNAEVDTDADGELDTRERFDAHGTRAGSEPITPR